jgi:hypothetical protein
LGAILYPASLFLPQQEVRFDWKGYVSEDLVEEMVNKNAK